jgi:hypothetical protein
LKYPSVLGKKTPYSFSVPSPHRTIWGSKSLGPIEKPLEIAKYVFFPRKKLTPRTIRISGALIVIKIAAILPPPACTLQSILANP